MKILVITYSHEVNPGTFLQAYGVQHALKKMFPEPAIEFIRHKKVNASQTAQFVKADSNKLNFLVSKIKAIPRRLKYEYYYRKCFKFTDAVFDFFDYDEKSFRQYAAKYDLIVVGSDTILIKLKGEKEQLGLMWLNGVDTKKILFSASAAPANFSISELEKMQLSETLNSFAYLGVRDSITIDLLANRIGNIRQEITKQMDPTYFLDNSCFSLPALDKRRFARIAKKKKIALLNFSQGFQFKEHITKSLKKKDFYVVSTHYNKDANENILSYNPFQWGALFKYISFSVTDRFHDSVFSLRNNKNVFCVDWELDRFNTETHSSKCSDLLRTYGINENHFVVQSQSNADALIEKIVLSHNNRDIIETIFQSNLLIAEKITIDYNSIKDKVKILV